MLQVFPDIANHIWNAKYRYKDEKTIDDTFKRVAKGLAETDQDYKDFEEIMVGRRFCPGGRILSTIGTERKNATPLNCFDGSTEILTNNGVKSIRDVKIGDMVLTHTGEMQRVEQLHQHSLINEEIFHIKCFASPTIKVTKDHKFWSVTKEQIKWGESLQWNSIDNLREGDFIAIPNKKDVPYERNIDVLDIYNNSNCTNEGDKIYSDKDYVWIKREKIHSHLKINRNWIVDKDFAFFLGLWYGDGCVFNAKNNWTAGITFTFGYKETELIKFVSEYGNKLLGISPKIRNNSKYDGSVQIRFDSRLLGIIFETLFGRGCRGKRLFDDIYIWNKNLVYNLLGGLISSDGTVTEDGYIRIGLTNKPLLKAVYHLVRSYGIPISFIEKNSPNPFCNNKNNNNPTVNVSYLCVSSCRELTSYVTKFYNDDRVQRAKDKKDRLSSFLLKSNGYILVRLNKKVKAIFSGDVFNIGVKNDNSYQVEGILCKNCFVMPQPADSMHDIMDCLKESAMTSRSGGGIGINFDLLRPYGEVVKGVESYSSGPTSFMGLWITMCKTIASYGMRRGAMLFTLFYSHPDILKFINLKRDSESYHGEFSSANLSVCATKELIDRSKANKTIKLFHWVKNEDNSSKSSKPHVIIPKFGDVWGNPYNFITQKDLDDNKTIHFHWNNGIYSTKVYDEIKASDLVNSITDGMYDNGEPGIIFIDMINERNSISYAEDVNCLNPCGEVYVGAYGSCLLGSINLLQHIDIPTRQFKFNLFKDTIRKAIRLMARVSHTAIFPLPEQEEANKQRRKIGLGITGLGNALAIIGFKYGKEAVPFINDILKIMANTAFDEAVNLTDKYGSFPLFDKEKYCDAWFIKKLDTDIQDKIAKKGIAFSALLSFAPTGTISQLLGNVSSGVEPIFSKTFNRIIKCDKNYDYIITDNEGNKFLVTEDEKKKLVKQINIVSEEKITLHIMDDKEPGFILPLEDYVYKNYPEIAKEDTYVTSNDLTVDDHLEVLKAAHAWVDLCVSKTVIIPPDYKKDDLTNLLSRIYDDGIKGLTVYRMGSRKDEPLSVDKKDSQSNPVDNSKELEIEELKKRIKILGTPTEPPDKITMNRWRIEFDGYTARIKIGPIHGKNPKEVIITIGKSGQVQHALCEALGRIISKALQYHVPPNEIASTLIDIKDGNSVFYKFNDKQKKPVIVTSIPDAIAKILLYNYVNEDQDFEGLKCPRCSMPSVIIQNGCETCVSCNWSKC